MDQKSDARVIEYFYSAHSAFTYLGPTRLIEIGTASGRNILRQPMDLSAVRPAQTLCVSQSSGAEKLSAPHTNVELAFSANRVPFKPKSTKGQPPSYSKSGLVLSAKQPLVPSWALSDHQSISVGFPDPE